MPAMIIGYARVSTADQNLALQLDALKRAGCERIFEDHVSGAKAKRPGLNNCLRALEPGDTLIVWRLDRLARSLIKLLELIQFLDKHDIALKSLTEAIDTKTLTGKLVLHVMGVKLAEFERGLIIERTNAGLQSAKDRGQTFGRPIKMTPAKLEEAKGLIVKGGLSVPAAAKRIGVSAAALYAALPGGKGALLGEGLPEDEIAYPE
jgi:DNA invertase Pin-like site-specific DNA recombinase